MHTVTIPRIKEVKTPRGTIINEFCTCRHLQSSHDPIGAYHGACTVAGCKCEQYTWQRFVFDTREIDTPGTCGRSARTELRALRRAIDANCVGSGPSVIARTTGDLRQFRIVGVKLRRGVIYGKELPSCKWVEIRDWDTF